MLVRADLNVPLRREQVADISRLERLLPTLKELREKGAKIVLLSHFGRPEARQPDPQYSLRPVAVALGNLSASRWLSPKIASAPKPKAPSRR